MYAVIVKLTIDPARAPAAAAAFSSEILPEITSMEGFHSGRWLDPAGGEGLGLVCFNTEQQARRLAERALSWSGPGVTILSADVRRVAVSI